MQIEERGVIYDATRRPEAERVASFTSLCQTSSGTIFSAFQIGSGKHAPRFNHRALSFEGSRSFLGATPRPL